jgi:hypothetical protein
MPHSNGGGWIRTAKRLAIYERDGWTCVYCARDVREARTPTPTLEHVYRHQERHTGDFNGPGNLVLACLACNSARNAAPLHRYLSRLPVHVLPWAVSELAQRTSRPLEPYMARGRELEASPPDWLREIRARIAAGFHPSAKGEPRPDPVYPPEPGAEIYAFDAFDADDFADPGPAHDYQPDEIPF